MGTTRVGTPRRAATGRDPGPRATGTATWHSFQSDPANTGYVPDAAGVRSTPRVAWHYPIDTGTPQNPCLDAGRLLCQRVRRTDGSERTRLVTLDAATGEEQWVGPESDYATSAGITGLSVDSKRAYVTALNGVEAISLADGTKVWRRESIGFPTGFPCLLDGTLYVAHESGVAALRSATGEVVWRRDDLTNDALGIAVADGVVVVTGVETGRLLALGASDGRTRWEFTTDNRLRSIPTVADGTVFAASTHGSLFAVDAAGGEKLWTRGVRRVANSVAVGADGVVLSDSQRLTALDPATGSVRWETDTANAEPSPVIADETVYDVTNDRLRAIDFRTGEVLWSIVLGLDMDMNATPVVGDGTVYVAGAGNLWAITTGESAADPSPDISFSPAEIEQGDTVTFDGTGSSDVDGSIETFRWRISNAYYTGETVRHSFEFTTAGNREADLLVVDDSGATGKTSVEVPLANPPTAGRQTLEASASDPTPTSATVTSAGAGPDGAGDGQSLLLALLACGVLGGLGAYRYRSGDDAPMRGRSRDSGREETPSDVSDGTMDRRNAASGTDSESAADATVPSRIPSPPPLNVSYHGIEQEGVIGTGGNAKIYRGTVMADDRQVPLAVKEPRTGGTLHTETVERLLAEAETWTALDDHDHVVDVVDYGSTPVPWIAMEYMDGGHLGERADEFTLDQALWTALAVTTAVRHAHRQGVAHLDLKPENVLFREVEGAWDVPKVADWGLSKRLLDHSNSIEGFSPQYAAPEQFDDEYGDTDELTDIYQLGAVLYELFAGRPPFEGQSAEIMHKTLTEEPTRPTDLTPELPAELDDVLLTALAKRKEDRYESVLYLRDQFVELLERADNDRSQSVTFGAVPGDPTANESPAGAAATPATDPSRPVDRSADTSSEAVLQDIDLAYADISIGEPLGRGAVSTVSHARVETTRGARPLALKEFQFEETVATDTLDRFATVADTWQQLAAHDGIVGVIDWDVEPIPWIAMEYMNRGALGPVIDRISPRQAVVAVGRIAEAVYHGHSRGTSHLGLHPSNVLLGTDDDSLRLKIGDWGMGALSRTQSQRAGELHLAYVAPEQFDDGYGVPGHASDVYALGAICYELFTGRPPFEGTPAEIMRATLAGDFRPPTTLDSTLPAEIDDIVATAMATDASDRYDSILYLRDALRNLS
ncbi:protein kinase domain-containing protein [Haloplanus pelagicus]|uniref:protein kinase domain-containing protein n=1 Tax=Haloplanus pelagicus TaxID=2949995 RepID=UPI00204106D8|nr:protein kinase [Haloplanus sp. HW8-1]